MSKLAIPAKVRTLVTFRVFLFTPGIIHHITHNYSRNKQLLITQIHPRSG